MLIYVDQIRLRADRMKASAVARVLVAYGNVQDPPEAWKSVLQWHAPDTHVLFMCRQPGDIQKLKLGTVEIVTAEPDEEVVVEANGDAMAEPNAGGIMVESNAEVGTNVAAIIPETRVRPRKLKQTQVCLDT